MKNSKEQSSDTLCKVWGETGKLADKFFDGAKGKNALFNASSIAKGIILALTIFFDSYWRRDTFF